MEGLIKKYDEVCSEIKEMKDRLSEMAREKEAIEAEIRARLDEMNFQKLKVDNITVYKRDDVYISPKGEMSIEWLKSNGLGHIVKESVNSRTLTSALKEEFKYDPGLKEVLAKEGIFNIVEKHRVGLRHG